MSIEVAKKRDHTKKMVSYERPSFIEYILGGIGLAIIFADDALGIVADEPLAAGCFIMLQSKKTIYYYCDICGEKWYE